MAKITILNDWHIGANRTGGTTPATAYQLRQDLLTQFEETLYGIDSDLMILGDLFDTPDISKADLLRTYQVLDDWMVQKGKNLVLVNGNHDLSKNSTNFSSFEFLAKLLDAEGAYAGTVTHVAGAGQMTPYGYVVPHVTNQDLFDIELSKVPECDFLFVHCNYDNEFAVESDHSLNLSRVQAETLPVKHIIFAHEHQAKSALRGKVIIIGNQVPSSVSDCLGNERKCLIELTFDDDGFCTARELPTWRAEGDFAEQDWRELADTGARFIRATGAATAAEAASVVQAISRFRQQAKALVITNAVKVEGVNDAADLALSHEEITAFNVREALAELLTPEENKRIAELEKNHAA